LRKEPKIENEPFGIVVTAPAADRDSTDLSAVAKDILDRFVNGGIPPRQNRRLRWLRCEESVS